MNSDVINSPGSGCVNSTIRLRSGSYFDLLNPQPEQFTLQDIAGALSKICRFGGQCPRFYSVAEHCVHCYRQAVKDDRSPNELAAILFHDSPEAFCGDVVKPLKLLLPEYSVIEKRVEDAIGAALGINFGVHAPAIREIDHAMLIAERRALFSADGVKWFGEDEVRQLKVDFWCWQPEVAEQIFISCASQIGKG